MNKNKIRHIFICSICCFLSAVMIYFSAPVAFADDTAQQKASDEEYREQISDLQNEQAALQQQMQDYNNKINNIKDSKKKQQAIANSIDEKISIIEESIAVGKEKIALISNYITEKNIEIRNKEKDIEDNLQLFRDRVKAIYMTGGYSDTANSLMMLLGSKSVSEFLTRTEFLNRIAEHDKQMVEELREELAVLNEEKAVLEEERAALEAEKTALEEEQASLEKELKEAKNSIHDLAQMQAEYEENYEELSAMAKQIQAELLDIYKNLNTSNTEYVGGEMMWPVPGYSKISSYYGWRFNNTDFHTGVDITGSGVHGAKVVAANTGTVVHTNYCPYNGYSYGYGTYLIVDHGGGITTLYAHLSDISVKKGDIVVMGQQIGKVGNTGWSTGAHLHFEVRKNGSAVNPISYIT
ncbi:MAG: peptidoglycan DD-metalloendopeptidase family protein [Oscillospiraceae bacterium]|nr:peptidoglycan DD-metalloendopeptidase family protein [Oscillospiraceae bacterium]MBQ2997653.1 peptidoglycan DD-metalloendopeptidase family protein [Oscillospiraceae bacterium]MBQ3560606.1 peptidoglycan DD-metalloendopeptidase family protein [Oscillospiraceae bacterium]MBQ6701032.1 peptidoglycan DD-metalloendopeptidase family protein [Oscillospiraceae bacterium]